MATLWIRIEGARLRGELELDGARVPFEGEHVVLGRDPACELRVASTRYAIARKHVRLSCHGSEILIEDLGSAAGIWRNRVHLAGPAALRDGDVIQIGVEDFHIRLG